MGLDRTRSIAGCISWSYAVTMRTKAISSPPAADATDSEASPRHSVHTRSDPCSVPQCPRRMSLPPAVRDRVHRDSMGHQIQRHRPLGASFRRCATVDRPRPGGTEPRPKGAPGGSNSVGRVSASQAECRGFESRLPLQLPLSCLARHSARVADSVGVVTQRTFYDVRDELLGGLDESDLPVPPSAHG